MDVVGARDALTGWAERKGDDGLVEYRETRNAESIDILGIKSGALSGLPRFERGPNQPSSR